MTALETIIETIGQGYESSASEIGCKVVNALDRAGFVITPKVATTKMICAALDDAERRERRARQSYTELYAAMIEARPE